MVELIPEVDENDNIIRLRPKEDFYTGKFMHRSVHLLLFNSKNEILVQKRALTKKWYHGLYTYSVSGTVRDESYEDGMKREMQEELGISIPVRYAFKYLFCDDVDKAFRAVFIGKTDKEISPDYGEMSEIKWISADKLKGGHRKAP